MEMDRDELLKEVYRLSKENSVILKRLQRQAQIASILGWVKWAVFIGFTLGAYYLIQPYLEQMLAIYSSLQGNVNAFQQNQGVFHAFTDALNQWKEITQ